MTDPFWIGFVRGYKWGGICGLIALALYAANWLLQRVVVAMLTVLTMVIGA